MFKYHSKDAVSSRNLLVFFPKVFQYSVLLDRVYCTKSYDNCPQEKFPPTLKLTLSQTVTLTGRGGGNFSCGQLSVCPPTLKLTLAFTQTPTLTGGNCPRGAIVGIPLYENQTSYNKT